MILGIGNDLCDIRRIEKSLERFGDRFVQQNLHGNRTKAIGRSRYPRSKLCQALCCEGGLFEGTGDGVAPRCFLA